MKKVFPSTELYILIFLHNYFIMHDIKYYFSVKIIRQSREGKKNFFLGGGGRLPKVLSKSTIFFLNLGGSSCPLASLGSAPADNSRVAAGDDDPTSLSLD
jgi:hypothetical protein